MDFAERNMNRHLPILLDVWRESGVVPVKFQGGPKNLSPKEISILTRSHGKLQRGLTGDRTLVGGGYMDNKDILGAYLLYYWPISFMQISYAASHALRRPEMDSLKEKHEVKILDLGSGPGPASSALIDLFREFGAYRIQVTLLDSSVEAMNVAQKIVNRDDGKSISFKTQKVNLEKVKGSLRKYAGEEKFDVIVMSHSLNELWKVDNLSIEKRIGLLEELMGLLNDDGMLLVCEPALLETSRALLEVRDGLLKKNVCKVISPCEPCGFKDTDSFRCPALSAGKNQTCHVEVDWNPGKIIQIMAAEMGLNRSSVKMTYVAFTKPDSELQEADDTKASGTSPSLSGVVVSEPMLNKAGRIRYVICDSNERITVSAKQDDQGAADKGFFNLKRMDHVVIESAEVRGDGINVSYGITEATKITAVPFAPSKK